jgi:hypothetical protein
MRYGWRLIYLVGLALYAGCGFSSKDVRLQGEVSFDGRPVEKGQIDFLPVDGTAGGAANASIAGGQYEFPPETGLLSTGAYAVRIIGLRKTGRKEPNRAQHGAGPPIEVEENFIPPIYNSDSTLRVRIADLPDKNKVDFHLGRTPDVTARP